MVYVSTPIIDSCLCYQSYHWLRQTVLISTFFMNMDPDTVWKVWYQKDYAILNGDMLKVMYSCLSLQCDSILFKP